MVFLTIVAASLYAVSLDFLVKDIWLVALYAVVLRISFNLLMGRALLLNWPKELVLSALGVSLTWLMYENFIRLKKTLLPDFSTATNELWVFIGLFLYLIVNSIDTGVSGSERRKALYLRKKVEGIRRLYGPILDAELPTQFGNSIAMSILIYECFNRPRVVQSLERLLFPKFSKTIGPMQVGTTVRITDFESVRLGCKKIAASHELLVKKAKSEQSSEYMSKWAIVRGVAADYNKDDSYVSDVMKLQEVISKEFYPLVGLEKENLDFSPFKRSV